MKSSAKKPATAKTKTDTVALLIATKKGGFILSSDNKRRKWDVKGPIFLGNIVHHMALDPREGRVMLMAAKTGHLGPTVFRSKISGRRGRRRRSLPRSRRRPRARRGAWLITSSGSRRATRASRASGTRARRRRGCSARRTAETPGNRSPGSTIIRCGRRGPAGQDGTPDGPKMHSINIDPRDPNRIYIGMSSGGVFESTDRGADWKPLNAGCAADFLPDPNPEYGHDPHCVRLHPLEPDVLYQQNHCGIYRMDRRVAGGESRWARIGEKMPKSIGDIGFPMVLHPRDPNTVWVFPMDGTQVWPRTLPEASPPHTSPTTAERPGSGWTKDCHRNRHGSPSFDRR